MNGWTGAVQRAHVNPDRLEGCSWSEVESQLEDIARNEDLFENYTPRRLLAGERRLAKILDFEKATRADYLTMLRQDDHDLLLDEVLGLLYGDDDHPRMKRQLRALAGAPLEFRTAIAVLCDPRGPDALGAAEIDEIREIILRREIDMDREPG
jgi:hypothetical protein